MGFHNLQKRIKSNEGFASKPYKDQLGYLTIGYGHLILSNEKILLKKTHKKKLEEILGLKISINNKKNNSGKIIIEYKDLDQFDMIKKLLSN